MKYKINIKRLMEVGREERKLLRKWCDENKTDCKAFPVTIGAMIHFLEENADLYKIVYDTFEMSYYEYEIIDRSHKSMSGCHRELVDALWDAVKRNIVNLKNDKCKFVTSEEDVEWYDYSNNRFIKGDNDSFGR